MIIQYKLFQFNVKIAKRRFLARQSDMCD